MSRLVYRWGPARDDVPAIMATPKNRREADERSHSAPHAALHNSGLSFLIYKSTTMSTGVVFRIQGTPMSTLFLILELEKIV